MHVIEGCKCSERITVKESRTGRYGHLYVGLIDDAIVTRGWSSRYFAARAAQKRLEKDEAKVAAEKSAEDQRLDDRSFIDELAYDLKIDSSRIDELLKIAARRSKEQ